MAIILNIETSTTACSVSLSEKGHLLNSIFYDNGYSHAENLHLFIQRLLNESNINIKTLDAVAVSKGPGSYTGLRIGVSAAKGLAYSLNVPLLAVDTLKIMAVSAQMQMPKAQFFCPMIDARRMEVYTNVYNHELEAREKTEALIIDENSIDYLKKFENLCFFGNGYLKAKDLLLSINHASFVDGIVPSAEHMIKLSYQKYISKDFEDIIYFEPFYLKDFLILKKN